MLSLDNNTHHCTVCHHEIHDATILSLRFDAKLYDATILKLYDMVLHYYLIYIMLYIIVSLSILMPAGYNVLLISKGIAIICINTLQ
jgi:hypothetical protein